VLVKTVGLLALMCFASFGQEGVKWDPRETGELSLSWKTALIGLAAIAYCGLWKLVMWLLVSKRSAGNWKKVQLWWPAAMLVWAWTLALLNRWDSAGLAWVAVMAMFGLLNFPVLLVMGPLIGVLDQAFHQAVWVNLLLGSLTIWGGNYLLVRLAEWRIGEKVPVSLHLADPASGRATDVRS
jgi:hypothetical protein